ncbi:MAG: tRNA (guanosine(46)-N7)-methyltransferase TrmB [Bacteroidales bacterium]|nr:tRNA (guanosine(46)-N7)-methyltransferase TrmB [Bacteroidales bacterium]
MGKNKLQHYKDIDSYNNLFQYSYDDIKKGFPLKGKWKKEYFKNDKPITLELGCGKGEYTLGLARKYPNKNFIGIDIKGARLWRGATTALEERINNIAFIRTRIELIEDYFDEGEVDEIWITFPDPHPKTPRIRKRLTNPRFLEMYRNILAKGSTIHLKTDNQMLFDYTFELLNELNLEIVSHTNDVYNSDIDDDILSIKTFYEKKFLKENISIKYLKFRIDNV